MTDCGTPSHQPECLCDVVIAEATPINFGLTQVWHAEAIARALGAGVPWKSADVASFGESLLKAYDIWSRDERRGERIEGEVLRLKVIDHLRTGRSMTTAANALGVSWKTLIHAMTNNVPAAVWSWDEVRWLEAEALIYDHFNKLSGEQLAKKLGGVHHCVVDQLAEWYGVKVNENGQQRLDTLKQLLRDGLRPFDAMRAAKDLGIEVTGEQLCMLRKRMAERGEVPSVLPRRLVAS